MTTDKKAEANRRNAQRSTGPRSTAGKAVVSRNARKHGLLSRNLVIDGESQEEFAELLRLLDDELQPVGLVEHALVERVGIAIWRQRRLVRAESAEVSLNQQRFGDEQRREVGHVLGLDHDVYSEIVVPDGETEDAESLNYLRERRKLWKSLLDGNVADEDDPVACMPEELRKSLLRSFKVEAGQVASVVKKRFGSWSGFFEAQVSHFEMLIARERIPGISRLVMQSQALPSQTDLLARYQTALDNDLYKALKALREAQVWRQARVVINVPPALPGGNGEGE